MVFPVVGGTQATGDIINNSVRFDNNANYLYADRFGSATNADKYTLSFWIKRCSNGAGDELFSYNYGNDSSNIGVILSLRTDDTLRFNGYAPGSDHFDVRTNRLFRDPSAWYHLVFAYDSTQSTASNRQKIYVNGAEETSLAASSYTSQNFDGFLATTPNSNKGFIIGSRYNSSGGIDSASYTDGYMADVHFTDGYAYAASDFGETNNNGVWVPKKADVTFGTNGYHLEFKQTGTSANASGIGADTSGNDNHFSVGNITSIDVTTDTPQNNFATLNPLDNYYASSTFSEGNVKMVSASTGSGTSTNAFKTSTFGLTSGKWYWEAKLSNATGYDQIGISQLVASSTSDHLGNSSSAYSIRGDTGNFMNNNSAVSYGVSFTTNDIISVALDLDNNLIYFYKNGTVMNSGTGKSISAGTYFPSFGKQDPAAVTWEVNFGNPSFSISSGNSDGAGYGNFEYAVPSGYYSCCTKNLAEYG